MNKKLISHYKYRDHECKLYVVIDDLSAMLILHECSDNYYDVNTEIDIDKITDEYLEDKECELVEHFFLVDRNKLVSKTDE